jgi:hypothetical protein
MPTERRGENTNSTIWKNIIDIKLQMCILTSHMCLRHATIIEELKGLLYNV